MEHRVTKLETSFEAMSDDMDSLVCGQREMNAKLDAVLTTMAEARGAAKLGKIVGGFFMIGVSSLCGLIGGNMAASSKIQEGVQQVLPHVR